MTPMVTCRFDQDKLDPQMPEPLKNFYSRDLITMMGRHLKRVHPAFDLDGFVHDATTGLDALELKQRSARIRDALHRHLPAQLEQAIDVMLASLHPHDNVELSSSGMDADGIRGWAVMPMSDLVGRRCGEAFDAALLAQKEMTKRFSSEFGIRHLILHDQDRAMTALCAWARDENYHVRRLASEGTRPRLPWAMQLPAFMADPAPCLPILETLKDDPVEYVRRSVANHLNDIAKDNPDTTAQVCSRWMNGGSEQRRKLVRHALRTLVKQGHPLALETLGFGAAEIELAPLQIRTPVVRFGEALAFESEIRSTARRSQQLVVDFIVHWRKANGETAPKVFKLKTLALEPGESVRIRKHHPIRPITTRKYYPGIQAVELQINGRACGRQEFELVMTD